MHDPDFKEIMRVVEAVTGQPRTPREIASLTGLDQNQVQQICVQLPKLYPDRFQIAMAPIMQR